MGIRESLNENPAITTGVTAGIIGIAILFIVYQIFFSGPGTGSIITEQYYTVDDGANYFADELSKLTPFDKDGKPAVTAYVFRCDGGDEFVGYLERFTETVRKEAAKLGPAAAENPEQQMQLEMLKQQGREVKKPGAGNWVDAMSPEGMQVTAVQCPGEGDDAGELEPVYPGM